MGKIYLQFSISVFNREPNMPTLVKSAKTSFIGAFELLRGFGFSDGQIDKVLATAVGETRMASCDSDTRHCQVMKLNIGGHSNNAFPQQNDRNQANERTRFKTQ